MATGHFRFYRWHLQHLQDGQDERGGGVALARTSWRVSPTSKEPMDIWRGLVSTGLRQVSINELVILASLP